MRNGISKKCLSCLFEFLLIDFSPFHSNLFRLILPSTFLRTYRFMRPICSPSLVYACTHVGANRTWPALPVLGIAEGSEQTGATKRLGQSDPPRRWILSLASTPEPVRISGEAAKAIGRAVFPGIVYRCQGGRKGRIESSVRGAIFFNLDSFEQFKTYICPNPKKLE